MMMKPSKTTSPPIEAVSWGRFKIRGKEHGKSTAGQTLGVGKDICLIGEAVSPWKERKGHLLSERMVECVLNQGIEILVIGNGALGAIEVPEQVKNYLRQNGIKEIIVEKTSRACATYNRLFSEGARVALLAHGTC